MARSNVARAESIVTLNGKAAENALDGLKLKAKQYRDAIIEASKAGDTKQVNKLSTELKSIEATTKKLRQETFNYNSILKNLNGSTITQLEKAAKSLRNEIKGLTPDTQLFITKSKQLDQVRNRLDVLNGRFKENNNWISRAGNSFNKYFGLATAAIASVTGISFALRGASQEAAKFDDIYADVSKTTQLTREEVVLLNEEFKKLNTRTSREELNELAREAGKLGLSGSEDVLAFVRAANKINVALREDLGEDAVLNIGKISEVFKLTKEMGIEKSYASIGSAINALGQDSSAAEQYLVDFTKRVAGSSYQAGISLQNILGYASALDQSGAQVEMSATAFQNFLMKMYSETDTMAKIAGVDVKAFSKLLSEDANAAIIKVLTGLNSKGGFAQMVPLFQEMGGEGARFVSVLSSLGTNINLVTEAQKLSNVEFTKATSLQNEYNIKNETMQAKLDKAKKKFQDQVIILGEKLSPAFLKSTNATTLFLKAIMAIDKEFLYAAAVFVGAIVAYKSWNVVVATGNTIMSAARITSLAFSAAMALVRGNTVRATAAWQMLNASMSASALGAIITAIAALGYGMYKLITYQSDLTKATKSFYSETETAKREAADLLGIVQNSVVGSDQYKQAIEKLVEKYGPYISYLIDEKGNLTNIEEARKLINNEIERSIGLKIKEQAVTDITNKAIEKQADAYEDIVKTLMDQAGMTEDVARIQAQAFTNSVNSGRSWKTLVNQLNRDIGRAFNIAPFRQYANAYTKMIDDVNATTKKFEFLMPEEIMGPVFDPTKVKAAGEQVTDTIETETEKQRKKKEEAFKKELESIDVQERQKQNLLKKSLFATSINQEQYELESLTNTIAFLEKRNLVYLKYGKDNTETEGAYYDSLIKLGEVAIKKAEIQAKIREFWLKKGPVEEDIDEDPEQDKLLKSILDKQKKFEQSAAEIKEQYASRSWSKKFKVEKENLEKMHKEGLITTKEYEWKIGQLRIEAAEKVASAVNGIVNAIAELYQTIRDEEFNRLERQKEQELRLYGDSADARAKIEQKYEKKKLELQIEYADKDMAIKILQTVSAGALAAIQAVAQLGPIAGPIAAALIGATTLFQVGTIIAQRNALKSSLQEGINSTSTSGNSKSVSGYAGGGFTENSNSDLKPVGIVHANEWVAPASMVRSNPSIFRNLERERVNKYSFQGPPKQFFTGGYASSANRDSKTDQLLQQAINLLKQMAESPIPAYMVLDEFNAKQEIKNRFKREGNL